MGSTNDLGWERSSAGSATSEQVSQHDQANIRWVSKEDAYRAGAMTLEHACEQAPASAGATFDPWSSQCITLCITKLLSVWAMATRTVRLDEEAEQVLASLTRSTGLSISEVLKRGLMAHKQQVQNSRAQRAPYEIFRKLDLGPGGYARAAAKDAQLAIRATIARKHNR